MDRINNRYRNVYSLNRTLEFENPIPLKLDSRTIQFQMFSHFHHAFDENLFSIDCTSKESIPTYICYDESVPLDGYHLVISKQEIRLSAKHERGIHYAIDEMNRLVTIKDNKRRLPLIQIEDTPSFPYRGIIEGYYGTPWTYEERLDLFPYMKKHRLNTYIYGPKSDPYHREKWCDDYPHAQCLELANLVDVANENQIDFWYTISPGYIKSGEYAFDYLNEQDFQRLFRKIDQLISLGIHHFGLLLDDIDYELTNTQKKKFQRPGIAHAYICNRLYEYVTSVVKDANFVMCPTEYHQIGETLYRYDLKEHLHENIKVFFTGDNVVSEVITSSDMSLTEKAYQKELFVWDNFPVSDFTYGVREFIAPIENRTVDMNQYSTGYFINPSIHYSISKIGMSTMADFAWNTVKYQPLVSFENSLREVSDQFYEDGKAYFMYNYPSVISYGNLQKEKEMVEEERTEDILAYLEPVYLSCQKLLTYSFDIIEELKPWLNRTINEIVLLKQLLHNQTSKEAVISFLEDSHFSGSELLDYYLLKNELLSKEEYETLITKRRGPKWYRVFEEKKWKR